MEPRAYKALTEDERLEAEKYRDRMTDSRERISAHEFDLYQSQHKLRTLIAQRASKDFPQINLAHFNADPENHRCGSAPYGSCVYDDRNDPANDECLYCGEPDERK